MSIRLISDVVTYMQAKTHAYKIKIKFFLSLFFFDVWMGIRCSSLQCPCDAQKTFHSFLPHTLARDSLPYTLARDSLPHTLLRNGHEWRMQMFPLGLNTQQSCVLSTLNSYNDGHPLPREDPLRLRAIAV